MIEIDEETVDQAIDDILSPDEPVRDAETPSVGGAQMAESEKPRRIYLNRCKGCGATFETPFAGGKLCPACKRKRISEGQKARQRREHQLMQEQAAENDTQIRIRNNEETKKGKTVKNDEKAVEEAWAQLGAPEPEQNKPEPAEPPPEDWSEDELRGKLAKGLKKDAGDVVLALYECIRDVARTAGMQPRIVLETMYEIDCTIRQIGGV